uniref:Pyrimidine dimer DNA glycosylase /DNA-(Apurinic or apyrimidinic site) lyase n=1 Tax=Candidatus Kentrum sp. DK TaxID=2126562 RepID=A0A450SHG4_9GAMM|nr:MAG: Pyrimidine dimer DNA glycosylase /DNA-(apurinic or apyrimidinic site) lyase [Candidatus Kentron sp. DK]VFJ52585.1 MAG: Pyrimidine dimer DNA glycosylase /DNA-(apurinic or apyrimidinic site) lyase [Candidatus Kentron sp. DK]
MRIWDIDPGYLNRQSLLGEHRELHGIVSILLNGKKGYAHHPETMRWSGRGWALGRRHRQLVCEMALRGYVDRSPVETRSNEGRWPTTYIDAPHLQFRLLGEKYADREKGRIPLPANEQALWSHYKYSILARDPERYREIGRAVSRKELDFDRLALELVAISRTRPGEGGMRNAIEHMWGHVSRVNGEKRLTVQSSSVRELLLATREIALEIQEPYLMKSTALGELMAWMEDP